MHQIKWLRIFKMISSFKVATQMLKSDVHDG
jgi:hypothetical protein